MILGVSVSMAGAVREPMTSPEREQKSGVLFGKAVSDQSGDCRFADGGLNYEFDLDLRCFTDIFLGDRPNH
jgi:hypothetical protein